MTVKVLILEDSPVARSFLCRVVRESFSDPLAITEAGDLDTARRHINLTGGDQGLHGADPFRLILVDLELPDGNGMDVLAELAHYPAAKIVTTNHSDDGHLFPALRNGADGYLLKDDKIEVLVEELRKIVRGQPPLSPAIARRLVRHFRDVAGSETDFSDSGLMHATVAAGNTPATIEKTPDHERLTPRERQVLTYLSKGFTIKEIAGLMEIRWFTVNDHIKSIYKKLDVSSRAEAAVIASKQGLV